MASSAQCACSFPRPFSSEDVVGTIRRVLRTEFLNVEDGTTYSRKHVCGSNPNQWRQVGEALRPFTPPPDKLLWVVRQHQQGKGPHWSLFAAFDDNSDAPKGRVWQVTGDPDVGMRYTHRGPEKALPIFLTRSFADKFLVCDNLSEQWEAKVDEIANIVKPPGPPQEGNADQPRKIDFRRGTCKTWLWEVLDQLVKEGIVSSEAAENARKLPDLNPQ